MSAQLSLSPHGKEWGGGIIRLDAYRARPEGVNVFTRVGSDVSRKCFIPLFIIPLINTTIERYKNSIQIETDTWPHDEGTERVVGTSRKPIPIQRGHGYLGPADCCCQIGFFKKIQKSQFLYEI